MTEAEIYAALTPVFNDVFLRDDLILTSTLSADDIPEWDSYKQIEILVATEQLFAIKFSSRETDNLANVGDLVSLVGKKKR